MNTDRGPQRENAWLETLKRRRRLRRSARAFEGMGRALLKELLSALERPTFGSAGFENFRKRVVFELRPGGIIDNVEAGNTHPWPPGFP